jgi:hypothetical protein
MPNSAMTLSPMNPVEVAACMFDGGAHVGEIAVENETTS